jgi:hypothetical protein
MLLRHKTVKDKNPGLMLNPGLRVRYVYRIRLEAKDKLKQPKRTHTRHDGEQDVFGAPGD